MANSKNNIPINPNTLLIVGGGLFAYAVVIKPILNKLGITQSIQAKAIQDQTTKQPAWSPAFYQSAPNGAWLITTAQAKDLAYKIYQYPGIFWDDFNTVLGVFQTLRTKSQLSFLCDVFQKTYNASMYGYLLDGGGILPWDGLSEVHLTQIINYVNSLPDYFG